jgi:hypothetical protein
MPYKLGCAKFAGGAYYVSKLRYIFSNYTYQIKHNSYFNTCTQIMFEVLSKNQGRMFYVQNMSICKLVSMNKQSVRFA